jgi:hypothetical protein
MSEQSYVPYQDSNGEPLNIFAKRFNEKDDVTIDNAVIDDEYHDYTPIVNKVTIAFVLAALAVMIWFFV